MDAEENLGESEVRETHPANLAWLVNPSAELVLRTPAIVLAFQLQIPRH